MQIGGRLRGGRLQMVALRKELDSVWIWFYKERALMARTIKIGNQLKNQMKTFITICVLVTAFIGKAENSIVLSQTNSPLQITSYGATFEAEYRGDYLSHPDEIIQSASYKNVTSNDIVAVQIGFAAFDAFNGFMDSFSGWSIENVNAGETNSGKWEQTPYAAFSFKTYGTGVAYVKAVRFADGTIWRADMSSILTQMQKFEKDLTKEDLQEKKK